MALVTKSIRIKSLTCSFLFACLLILNSCTQNKGFELLGIWEGKFANRDMSRSELRKLNNMMQGSMELEFLNCGKVNMSMSGYVTVGSYYMKEESIFITADGLEKVFKIINNQIELDIDGQLIKYSKIRNSEKGFNQNSNEAVNSLIMAESKSLYAKWQVISIEEPEDNKSPYSAMVYGMEMGSTLVFNKHNTFAKSLSSGKSMSGEFIERDNKIKFIQDNGFEQDVEIISLAMGLLTLKEVDTGIIKKYERVYN